MHTEKKNYKSIVMDYSNLFKNPDKEKAEKFLSFDEKLQTDIAGVLIERFGNEKISLLVKKIAEVKAVQVAPETDNDLLLLSSSPRRHFILKEILGLSFSSQTTDTNEYKPSFYTRPETVTTVIALMKLLSIFDVACIYGKYVIASDTLCHLKDGTAMGKPQGETLEECLKDAEHILKHIIPGSLQTVSSSVMVFDLENYELHIKSASTKIKFKPASDIDEDILNYYLHLSQNKKKGRGPVGKAGGYGVQEPEILYITEYIKGDPFTVIALPIYETIHLLERCGLSINRRTVDKDLLLDAVWGKKTCLSMDVYPFLKNKFASDFSQLAKQKIINF